MKSRELGIRNSGIFFNRRLKKFLNSKLKTRNPKFPPFGIPPSEEGWTLIELMLTVALIAIITPAITFLFSKATEGMASDEMHTQMTTLNTQTQLRLHERLVANRHFFQGGVSMGVSFLRPVTTGMSSSTTLNYPILAGSVLPQQQPSGSFSTSSATVTDFGNSLLFAAYDSPQTFGNQIYTAPASIVSVGGNPLTFSSAYGQGAAVTVVIDLYRFYYYYLTSKNPRALRSTNSYQLIEWQSGQYADYNELGNISDSTLKKEVIGWLATPGNLSSTNSSYAVTWAYDPTQTDPNAPAFYTMGTNGGITAVTNPALVEGYVQPITHVPSGILSTGFAYGIAPDSTFWNGAPVKVPLFNPTPIASATPFPGGFEVGMEGTAAGEQILVRHVLVAQGAAPGVIYTDQTIVTNIRDTW
jgi:type II secretory pathway pseudopilin PulG